MKKLLHFLAFIHLLAKLCLLIEVIMIVIYFGIYKSELLNNVVLSRLILVVTIPLIILFTSKYLINKIESKQ